MTDFSRRYAALNQAQKLAVDTIEGPVMVVAGPGTGKTELLSVRVANILQKTDELPGNILCLTFTESGASALRERLAGLIGADAYKVSIHTFHSFGTEIINRYSEYFYHGAHFRPADELSAYETLREIFEKLPHDNPLSTKMNNEYTYLRDTQSAISDLKKSGLTPDELLQVMERNDAFCEWIQPRLQEAFGDRLSKKQFPAISKLIQSLDAFEEESLPLINYQSLAELFETSLQTALDESESAESTKALSAWKRDWCEKREDGQLTLKDVRRSQKIRAVAGIYYEYLIAMQARQLYDFDDMILRVVHAIEVFNDLRLNLQEQYHYIMVDEFQDTNDAQMRVVWNLTNSAINEGRPNLLVVGDDDQAIYRFQGANISNILDFRSLYRDVELISLTDNYRSSAPILETSRDVIIQGQERLETTISTLNKSLIAHRTPLERPVEFISYETELQEYSHIAERLTKRDRNKSYAIITRHHRQLKALLPYLQAKGLPLRYDAQENILENPVVRHVELIAQIVYHISQNQLPSANALLPEMLAHPAWQIETRELWQLSVKSNKDHRYWLELMLEMEGRLHDIAGWLLMIARYVHYQPLEYVLDLLIGSTTETIADTEMSEATTVEKQKPAAFISPLKAYYFDATKLKSQAIEYTQFLYALRTLRTALREYRPDQVLALKDFIEFLELHRALNLPIQSASTYGADDGAIELMTAHRAKGLEFDDVTLMNLTDDIWGETSRGRPHLLRFPHNLPIDQSGDNTDERLRLLYVAMTRARDTLHLTTHASIDNGKDTPVVGYLINPKLPIHDAVPQTVAQKLTAEQIDWRAPLINIADGDQQTVLKPLLERYKLSATHLNNFLDVTNGGPSMFLLHNLLRFPQALSPNAAYGSAMHLTLQRAHQHLSATGKRRPVEDILGDFETELRTFHLPELEFERYLARGADALNIFLGERYESFNPSQVAERSFSSQGITVGNAVITGVIDLIEVDEKAKTITVTDYKTGKASNTWQGKTEFEKIKLHHYRQQLMFYKLLLENSREYENYTVIKGIIEYVEPNQSGNITCLEFSYDAEEVERFKELIQAVWLRIMALDFSCPDQQPGLKTILAFESELLT